MPLRKGGGAGTRKKWRGHGERPPLGGQTGNSPSIGINDCLASRRNGKLGNGGDPVICRHCGLRLGNQTKDDDEEEG